MKEGFIFVNQDVRGRIMSEGTFVDLRPHIAKKATPQTFDESTDTYDTIDWLVKNVPDNNGKVGVSGISLSRLLRRHGAARRASRPASRLAAGARRRLVHGRRLLSRRRVHDAAQLRLLPVLQAL